MHPLAGIKKFGSLGFLADTQFFKEIRYSKIKKPILLKSMTYIIPHIATTQWWCTNASAS